VTNRAFGKWKASGFVAPEIVAAPPQMPVQKILLERPGSVQATLRLGQPGAPASSDDEVALRLTSTILGTGFSSRININLREEKGYTYGARAGSRSLRVGGAITGAADVRNEVAGASLKEFHNEYRRIGTDLVPDPEMQLHKRYVAGSFLLANQMQAAVAHTLANNWLIGLPADFFTNYVPNIQRVNAEQVRDIARKYFVPENQSIVVVGDKAAIAEQLKAFGEFTSVTK
jgi:predicted Zn-dependent peptidase